MTTHALPAYLDREVPRIIHSLRAGGGPDVYEAELARHFVEERLPELTAEELADNPDYPRQIAFSLGVLAFEAGGANFGPRHWEVC